MFSELLSGVPIPQMHKVLYQPPVFSPIHIPHALDDTLTRANALKMELENKTVAITCGSRDIGDIVPILRHLVFRLRQRGAKPFIVPAMGSHGGATAEGQKAILMALGVQEETVGAPICSCMDTVEVGTTESGIPVYMDKLARRADVIIPVGRVKPHTEFHGDIESGVLKMIAIGLGKQKGASVCHALGRENLSQNIVDMAQTALLHAPIPFGIAIVENAGHRTHSLTAIPARRMLDEEKKLLKTAKELVPRIPFSNLDMLVVYEMGKDISGTGMDSNVTGRSIYLPPAHPFASILAVLRLTEKSHHNANGIGCADVTVQRLVDCISPRETFPNAITSLDPKACRIPVFMPDDRQALQLGILFSHAGANSARLVMIQNTLDLGIMYISDALLRADGLEPYCTLAQEHVPLFQADGNLLDTLWNRASA